MPTLATKALSTCGSKWPFHDAIRRSDTAIEAIDIARRTGDDATLLAVLSVALSPLITPATLERRLQETRIALALADRSGDLPSRFQTAYSSACTVMEAGDLSALDARIAEMDTIAERTGLPFQWWQLLILRSWRHLLAGRAGESEADANAALEIGTRSGFPVAFSVYGAHLMQLCEQQGRLAEFVEVAEQGVAENPAIPTWRMVLMNIYCKLGRHDDCAALFDIGQAAGFTDVPFNAIWPIALGQYAECAADLGRRDAAPLLYEMLLPYASRFAFVGPADGGAVARYVGRLATLLGRYDDAETHLRDALALHERPQAPYWIACTELDLAELCVTRRGPDDSAAARDHIQQAQRAIDQYGYAGLSPRAERLLQRL